MRLELHNKEKSNLGFRALFATLLSVMQSLPLCPYQCKHFEDLNYRCVAWAEMQQQYRLFWHNFPWPIPFLHGGRAERSGWYHYQFAYCQPWDCLLWLSFPDCFWVSLAFDTFTHLDQMNFWTFVFLRLKKRDRGKRTGNFRNGLLLKYTFTASTCLWFPQHKRKGT